MLIMTANDANQVRGLTVRGHALAPRPLADGTFALPVEVLNDPNHESKWDYLIANASIEQDSLIRRGTLSNINDPNPSFINSDWSQDSVVIAANTYNPSTWLPGMLITV